MLAALGAACSGDDSAGSGSGGGGGSAGSAAGSAGASGAGGDAAAGTAGSGGGAGGAGAAGHAGGAGEAASGGSGGGGLCEPSADAGPIAHPWAAPDPAACSEADLEALELVGAEDGPDAYSAAHASCGACVFSDSEDASWRAVVYVGKTPLFNSPACIDALGGDASCAGALNESAGCQAAACRACGEISIGDGAVCLQDTAGSGPCAALAGAANACVAQLGPQTDACFAPSGGFGGILRAYAEILCAGGVDAGTDAGGD